MIRDQAMNQMFVDYENNLNEYASFKELKAETEITAAKAPTQSLRRSHLLSRITKNLDFHEALDLAHHTY